MRALLSTALVVALTACAAAPTTSSAGNLLDLAVVDRDTGETLRTYRDHGKVYVAGTPGHRYSVRMVNRTGGRVMTVLSVDGVNAITGQTASANQSGYVLSPWESAEIAGWRKSGDEIGAIQFHCAAGQLRRAHRPTGQCRRDRRRGVHRARVSDAQARR